MQLSVTRSGVILKAAALVVTVGFAFPAAYLVWRNFTFHSDPLGVLFSNRTAGPLLRTLHLAVLVSISTALLGTTLAWFTIRCNLPWKRLWQTLLPLPLVFPTFIGAAALIRTLNPGGLLSNWLANIGLAWNVEMRGLFGAWLALTLFTYPYVYLPVAARLRRLPGSIEETARLLGDPPLAVIRRVVLPQIATATSAGTLLVFLYAISDFGAVQLMRYDTLSRAIYTTRLNNQPASLALSMILLGLAAVVVLTERAATHRFETSTPARTRRPVIYNLGKAKPLAVTFVAGSVAISLLGPVASLADWSIDGIRIEAAGGRELLVSWTNIWSPIWNTTLGSVLAAVAAVAVVLPAAYLAVWYRSRIGTVANAVIVSSFALPGILVGLGLLFWTLKTDLGNPLRNTVALLVFGYVVRFGGQTMRTSQVAVATMSKQLTDAARTLGANWLKRFRTLDLPLMAPGLLAGGGLVMLSVMKELPITLLIAPFDFPTLTFKAFNSIEEAFVAEAGIWSGLLVLLSGILTWLFIIRRAEHFD
ncbi:MAG: iron ABC transporter permease [Acidimicrobiia bacterium]|nr:iron ABC transporter permease [Acidimicrobiia bacterium]MYC58206.1 iron ABC transporter permease [Acidimicrobiia bacterium]MYI30323.1 iron ABC transporter permease [Acidimicrobiia bacterium]